MAAGRAGPPPRGRSAPPGSWAGTIAGAALGIGAIALSYAAALAANRPVAALIAVLALATHAKVAASARACRHCARPA